MNIVVFCVLSELAKWSGVKILQCCCNLGIGLGFIFWGRGLSEAERLEILTQRLLFDLTIIVAN